MNPNLGRFGNRIRELRLAAGLSQEELAHRCGLHRTYIGGIERGERNVGLINVFAIAAVLGESMETLFREASQSKSTVPLTAARRRRPHE